MPLDPALAALTTAGASAVVAAMATDAWRSVRSGVARLLGRGQPDRVAALERELEESRADLERLEGDARQRAATSKEAALRSALAELLTEQPQSREALVELLTLAYAGNPSVSTVTQFATATDDAQQVVQGSGVQSINFGTKRR
jgi:hypothetical protein